MPELADVEGWKRYVARYAAGKRVRGVHVRDRGVLRNTSAQGLGRALARRRLDRPRRHGKWLLVPAGDGCLVFHFGMTGELVWTSAGDEPHDFDRVIFDLDGGELRYRTQRKLGGVWWVPADGDVTDVTGPLGPDAASIDRDELHRLLSGRRGSIKAAVMNQALLAGIGNELSDEILWHARIRPDTPVRNLDNDQLDTLYTCMHDVLRRSMKHGRIPTQGQWLDAVRGQKDPTCPRCGTPIETATIAGRTAYFCPHCQP